MPQRADGFKVTGAERLEDGAGKLYRYVGNSNERVTVFVYQAPDTLSDAQAAVTAEGERFQLTFPIGVERGWYDLYRIAFADPQPVSVQDVRIPGHATGVATRRGRDLAVEVQYLYLICGYFVKVRGTLPGDNWMESTVPRFAQNLARRFYGSK